VSAWITGFTTTSTETVSGNTQRELYCAYAGISVSNLKYCNNHFAGTVDNTNLKDVGNVTLQIIYDNSTSEKFYLNRSSGSGFMSLTPRERDAFNVTIGGINYDLIHVYTNCSNAYDDATRSDVTAC
jgi:hypothetical protein